jgi:hypothetical protein
LFTIFHVKFFSFSLFWVGFFVIFFIQQTSSHCHSTLIFNKHHENSAEICRTYSRGHKFLWPNKSKRNIFIEDIKKILFFLLVTDMTMILMMMIRKKRISMKIMTHTITAKKKRYYYFWETKYKFYEIINYKSYLSFSLRVSFPTISFILSTLHTL